MAKVRTLLSHKVISAVLKSISVVAGGTLAIGAYVLPAQALTDTNADSYASLTSTQVHQRQTIQQRFAVQSVQDTQTTQDSVTPAMPQNPNAKLPSKVNSSIPDDATVVSENLAVTADGTVKDLATGKRVTDEQLVGSESRPADPLAKTGGENFIPVEAQEVKQAVQQAQDADDVNEQNSAQDAHSAQNKTASYIRTYGATQGNVRSAALMNNQYGAYWGSYNGYPAFVEYNGTPTQLYQWNNIGAQQYSFVRQSDGSYEIVNTSSGKALDIVGAIVGNAKQLKTYTYNTAVVRVWKLLPTMTISEYASAHKTDLSDGIYIHYVAH